MKKSFLLYCDQSELVNKLPDDKAGILLKTIYLYCCNNFIKPVIDDPLIDLAFTAIRASIDRDHSKYLKVVERNKINGKKGGRPMSKPKKPSGLSGNPKNPVKPDSDSDNDSDSETTFREIKKFTEEFIKYISKSKPNLNIKTDSIINNSIDTVEKLMRLDGFTLEYIKRVLRWGVQDDFWSVQINSLAPLRKKMPGGLTKFQNIANKYESQEPLNGSEPLEIKSQSEIESENEEYGI